MSGWEPDLDRYERTDEARRDTEEDWQEHLDLWRRTRDDALSRDQGERGGPVSYPAHVERVRDAGYQDDDPKGQER